MQVCIQNTISFPAPVGVCLVERKDEAEECKYVYKIQFPFLLLWVFVGRKEAIPFTLDLWLLR